MKAFSLLFVFIILISCSKQHLKETETPKTIYQTENLIITKLSNSIYEHTSFLQTNDFGKVPCNGMVVVDSNEAIVLDTPTDSISSVELIHYFKKQNIKIIAVVPTHFHEDCLGGLDVFHKEGSFSFANQKTKAVLLENKISKNIPQSTFQNKTDLEFGNKTLHLEFFGEGHTKDNVVVYFPDEEVLFGGCLIKEVGATKGYLGDANEKDWSETVQKIKVIYPNLKTVIPGHGKRGGMELLDYTIELFQ